MENLFKSLENKIESNVFKDKYYLSEQYIPEIIPHRKEQIKKIIDYLTPAFGGEKAHNLMLYGQSGTGKTLIMKYIKDNAEKLITKKSIPLKILYLNCKLGEADTEYKAMINICSKLGGNLRLGMNSIFVYKKILELLDNQKNMIIIFDEINYLIKRSGDNILYTFSRIDTELKKTYVNLIGITNDFRLTEDLDGSVLSSLGEISIFFPPYHAIQLKDILIQRIEKAFYQDVVDNSVIAKCSAISAQIGDARKMLDLLRVSGEIVDKEERTKITENDLSRAEIILEKNQIMNIVKQLPKQSKIILSSIIKLLLKGVDKIETGDVYGVYIELCNNVGIKHLTQSSVSNIISELDLLGVITSKSYSRGRFGKTREIKMYLNNKIICFVREYLEQEFSYR